MFRKCERCGDRMPFMALRQRLVDGHLVCATCFHAANDKCAYCDLDIFLTDDVKPMWVHTLTGNAKGVEGHAAAPSNEKVATFMDRMGPSKPMHPDLLKSAEPELLNLEWSVIPGSGSEDPDDPDIYKGEWFFKDYNNDRSHAHQILISYDDVFENHGGSWGWNAVFHNNWPGGPDLNEGFRDLGEKSGHAPTLDRAKADAATFIRDLWNAKVHLNEQGNPEQLRMGFGSKLANYPGLTPSTAFYIQAPDGTIIGGPYARRDTAVWASQTGMYVDGSTVVEGPSYEDDAGWHTAPLGFLDPGGPSKNLQEPKVPAFASRVLTSVKEASIQVVAHDSGDGQTIYHCPFCGSGNVVGRGDGTTECGYCHNSFTVQVQPQHPNMPQTNPLTGEPMDVPGMPGQIDRAEPGGPLPPDPSKGEQPRPPESSGPPRPPGAGKGGPPPPGGDKPGEEEKKPPPFAKGSKLAADAADEVYAHLLIDMTRIRHAMDQDEYRSTLMPIISEMRPYITSDLTTGGYIVAKFPTSSAADTVRDRLYAAGAPEGSIKRTTLVMGAKLAAVDDFQGKTVHVLRNTKYMGAFPNAEISPHDDPNFDGWYVIKGGGGQYFARPEDMFDSEEAAKAEASARRKPRGPNRQPQIAGEWGQAVLMSNPDAKFKTSTGHVLDEESYVRHLAIRHAGPAEIGRVLALVREEQQE